MPMTRSLTVRLTGPMPADTLRAVRDDLSLKPKGRLTDAEDDEFGYRYLQQDDQNWISLDLVRQDDTSWAFHLTYLNDPPPAGTVSQVLADVTASAERNGLMVAEVIR